MGNQTGKLSEFQKEKLLHEFRTFYDLDGDDFVTRNDFKVAQEFTRKINGWEEGGEKEKSCEEVFETIWDSLEAVGDKNCDGKINSEEWLLLWAKTYKKLSEENKGQRLTMDDLPMWCYRYIQNRFQLYDRTGDGVIDADEFEYVISHFQVSPVNARKAFMMFSENNERKVDMEWFCILAAEYYFSNEPAALGNFITGKLDFDFNTTTKKKE